VAHLCLCFLEDLWDQVFLEVLGDQPDLDHPEERETEQVFLNIVFEKGFIVASDLPSLDVTQIGHLLCLQINSVSWRKIGFGIQM